MGLARDDDPEQMRVLSRRRPISVGEFLTGRGLAAYELPDLLEIVPEFPVTALGKISKKLLVERLVTGAVVR